MRRRALIASLSATIALAVGIGAALAAPAAPPPLPPAACQQADQRLADLQARAGELTAGIAELEERLGGELTPKQTAKLERKLAKLHKRLGKVETRIDKLEARLADRCEPESPESQPGPTA